MTLLLSSPMLPRALPTSTPSSPAPESPSMLSSLQNVIEWTSPANTPSPNLPAAKRSKTENDNDLLPAESHYDRAANAFEQIFDITHLPLDQHSPAHLNGLLHKLRIAGNELQNELDVLFQTHSVESVINLSARFRMTPARASVWDYLVRSGYMVSHASSY